MIYSHRTAIRRNGPSKPIQLVFSRGLVPSTGRILDFGCGYGEDVQWLRTKSYAEVVGYDSYTHCAHRGPVKGKFDLIMLTYVINTLETKEKRRAVIREVWGHLENGGHLVISSRTKGDIKRNAQQNNWKPWREGYVTSRNTFQEGHTNAEILELAQELPNSLPKPAKTGGGFSAAILMHN